MLLVSSFDRLNIKWNESDSLLSYRLPRKTVRVAFIAPRSLLWDDAIRLDPSVAIGHAVVIN